jgi:hypothetical protein
MLFYSTLFYSSPFFFPPPFGGKLERERDADRRPSHSHRPKP